MNNLYNPDLNTTKVMIKKLCVIFILSAAVACHAKPSKLTKVDGSNDLRPNERQSLACKEVAMLVTSYNYKKVELDDSLSAVIFNRYLKKLDPDHNYLLVSDVTAFEKFKYQLDDDLKVGNLNNVFSMFNVFQKRYLDVMKLSLAHVNDDFDFNKNESFTYDRQDLPFATSTSQINELWLKRVKYDLLNLKLANGDMAKNRATLTKRYTSVLLQSNKLSNQDVFQIFMDSFTEAVDPHTNYFNPFNAAQFNMEMSRSLEGVGARLKSENDYVTISEITPGGPADKSQQIHTDDRIIGVAQGKDGEFTNVVGWRLENAIALIRGPKGSIVKLQLLPAGSSAGGKFKILELVREKIVIQDLLAKKEIRSYNKDGKTIKVGIINIPAFYVDNNARQAGETKYHSTTRDVKLLLDSLKAEKVDGIVLDLRGDGGGSLTEAISLTGLFISEGPVVQVKDASGKIEAQTDEDPSIKYDGPLAVLVDRFSASASEIFAGALQDYGRAIVLGSQTYGKGSVQREIELDQVIDPTVLSSASKFVGVDKARASGSESVFGQLNLTIAKFYRITGNSTQRHGVMPDITFPSVIPLDKYGEDTEPSAMPFDVIPVSNYKKFADLSPAIAKLKKLHDDRMAGSDSYKYLLQDITEFKKRDNERSITLNKTSLEKQRDDDEKKSLDRENLRRVALGFKPLIKGETKPKGEDLDFVKIEAGQIMTDYISSNTSPGNLQH